ncbi:MAG: hypothetical protein GC204_13230 [Chloroflexi bacterium]|nr:hypothetical protein [Chloroflexota bacterium]
MSFLKSYSKPELFALLAILILAALLRFAYPGVNSFAGDEAHISLDALRMARGGEFVMAGQPSSVNIPFFPASVWLFAIPYAFSPDPQVVTWVVSLVSLLTVVGVWWLARRWDKWAALVAALYMTASPYAVFYGRSIWQPNLLAPLALLWAITAYVGATQASRIGKIGVGLCVFLGLFVVQVHFAGIALVPATAYLIIRFRWWRKLIPVLVGAALAVAAMIPYVYTITVIDPSILARFGQVIGGGGTATIDLQGVGNLLRLGLGWDWAFLGMGDGDSFSHAIPTVIMAGAVVVIGLFALLLAFVRSVRVGVQRTAPLQNIVSPLTEIALVWLVCSPLVFLRHSTPVLIHYQLIELPLLALLAGASTLLFRRILWKIVISALMIALALVWSIQIMQTLDYTSTNRPPNSALSSILHESRDAAYGVEQPVLFFTHGDDPAIDGEAAVFKALLWTRDYRILNGDALLILPPYPATLLATLAPFQAWEEIEASGLALDVQTYPRRVGADPFMATRYDGISDPQGFTEITPIPFADGTTLLGWRVRRVGDRMRVSTLWRVEADAAPGTYQQFQHLHDQVGGDPLAISDVPLSRSTWRIGDRVIVMADFFNIAPGTAHLTVDIGHYTLPDLTRIARSDSSETGVTFGPFIAP